ncbi:hypothetical protein O3P69_017129 [Scylla paramamosain]|uniref:Uncharacterized protein n=1 Tax=Scylla paramamosain TaxID=85552 RepID=A0AAW0TU98_SCYPA
MGLKERREMSVISTLLDNDFPKLTCVDFTITVEMLIGQDAPAALTPLEVRSGRDGDLFAIRTELGWTKNDPLKPAINEDLSFNTFVVIL